MGIRSRVAAFAVLAVVVACGDNLQPKEDVDNTVVVALDTTAPTQVQAGDTIGVKCTLLENDITTMVDAQVTVVAEDHVIRMDKNVIAKTVGTVEVRCALPDRGLVDPTPAIVQIVHGPAANLVTTITPNPVVAGNSVTATCAVYDDYGNLIEDGETPALSLTPIDSGNTVTGLEALMTRAGHYAARCDLPGTASNNAGLDVVPNLPAAIVLSKWPDLPVYAVGAAVDVTHIVTDRYGNEILEATVTKTMAVVTGAGPATALGPYTWRLDAEGKYTVTATADPPTDGGVTLSASVDLNVNSRGPAISCTNDAGMINMTPGNNYVVTGTANDVNGVASLIVNGTTVNLQSDGSWAKQITTRFGMNFVDVTAIDTFGEPTTKVCTFLISNQWGSTSQQINDTVSLKLTQTAVDDNNRLDGLDSLDDILYSVLNSAGLSLTLHNALLASNPLKPETCDSQTCIPFIGCACNYSSGITYLDRSLPGPNNVSLALTANGLNVAVSINDPALKLRLKGEVVYIPYDTTGWVTFDYVNIQMTLDLALTGGKPRISIRPGTVAAQVGGVSTSFNGVDGWIINNILVPLAQGTIRDKVRDTLRDYISNNFNAVLDSVVSGLDISTLGTTFNVPRIDGTGNVPMTFGVNFSTVNVTSARAQFGIGTKFVTTAQNNYPSLGVASPPSTYLSDPTVSLPATTAVAAHVAVINGALHALWRANYFSAALSGASIPGLPSGVSFQITTRLPPVAMISSGGVVQMHLGAMDLTVVHPSLPPNLTVTLGADAHASVSLVNNDLIFGGIVIDQLHVSTDSINLSAQEQQDLEDVLTTLLQQLINDSFNDVLPALPIPSFALPASLAQFGLPSTGRLGLKTPTLTVAPQHFTLRGSFGVF